MIRKDNRNEVEIYNAIDKYNSRQEIRKYILNLWLEESPENQYRYFIEKFKDKNNQEKRIYLERPARLNKGCDFVIFCQDIFLYKNGNDKPPKHNDIIQDIKNKNLEKINLENLKKSIECIYNCKNYEKAVENLSNLKNWDKGLSYELILKLIKWYFIEQDVTYWLRTGRNMFWEVIKNI